MFVSIVVNIENRRDKEQRTRNDIQITRPEW